MAPHSDTPEDDVTHSAISQSLQCFHSFQSGRNNSCKSNSVIILSTTCSSTYNSPAVLYKVIRNQSMFNKKICRCIIVVSPRADTIKIPLYTNQIQYIPCIMHYSCFAVLSVVMYQIMFVFICELIQYKNKWHLISIGNPTMKIRRSYDRLITTMISPKLVRRYVYIQSRTWISSVALRQLHHGSLCVWAQSMTKS